MEELRPKTATISFDCEFPSQNRKDKRFLGPVAARKCYLLGLEMIQNEGRSWAATQTPRGQASKQVASMGQTTS